MRWKLCRNSEAFAWVGNEKGKNGADIPGRKNSLCKPMQVGRGMVGPGSENPSHAGPMDLLQKAEKGELGKERWGKISEGYSLRYWMGSHSGFWGEGSDINQIWYSLSEERSKPVMELPWSPVRSSSPHNPSASCPSSPASVEQNPVSPSPQEAGQAGDPGCGGDRRAVAAASSFLS